MRYIIINNLMSESLSFKIILTKVTFVTAGVASLMLDSSCFVLRLALGTFILANVLVKCYFEAFVALWCTCASVRLRVFYLCYHNLMS
jgi:hypothetical protein